jgi:His/Glu/Gln/Arg/opine family amino acid ABC transporter permease subunit
MESFSFLLRFAPLIALATVTTIGLLAAATFIGTILGIVGAVASRARNVVVRRSALAYSWIFRGSPPLIVLLFCYFGLGEIGLKLKPFQAAVLGLSLVSSAYFMEIFRAGIAAVPRGQVEAATALGISRLRIARRIVYPQTLPVVIPPYFSSVISNLKDTALASAIAVGELVGVSRLIIGTTLRPIEMFTVAAVIFVALGSLLVRSQTLLEKFVSVPR